MPTDDPDFAEYTAGMYYDPRITEIDGVFYLCQAAHSGHGRRLSLLKSTDFGVLRNNQVRWGWAKTGPGAGPIKTPEGWLNIFHGVRSQCKAHYVYQLGVCLLDLPDPSKVIAQSQEAILEPLEDYELTGQTPSVVFTSGAVVEDDGVVKIYYGGTQGRSSFPRTEPVACRNRMRIGTIKRISCLAAGVGLMACASKQAEPKPVDTSGQSFKSAMSLVCNVDQHVQASDDDPLEQEQRRSDYLQEHIKNPDVIYHRTLWRVQSTKQRAKTIRDLSCQAELKACPYADALEADPF